MAEEPSQISQAVSALGLLSRILSLLETMLPAFLVAWNGELKAKLAASQSDAAISKAELEGEKDVAKIDDETRDLSPRELLDRAIAKGRGPDAPPD